MEHSSFLYSQEIIRQLNIQTTITDEEKKWLKEYISGIMKVIPLDKPVKPATCDVSPIIEHLEKSFNRAQKYIDDKEYGGFDDLKMACAELAVSNAEVRQKLSKLSP